MARVDTLVGYAERLSVAPGTTARFSVNSPRGEYTAQLVRTICADRRPAGAGFQEQIVDLPAIRGGPTDAFDLLPGSYAAAGVAEYLDEGTISFYFRPTDLSTVSALLDVTTFGMIVAVGPPGLAVFQRLIAPWPSRFSPYPHKDDPANAFDENEPEYTLLMAGPPPTLHRWHWMTIRFRAKRMELTIVRFPEGAGERRAEWSTWVDLQRDYRIAASHWLIAAKASRYVHPRGTNAEWTFNGRMELPWVANAWIDPGEAEKLSNDTNALAADPRMVAVWDFSRDIGTDQMIDITPHARHGRFFNHPTQAVRGVKWDGTTHDWTKRSDHYGAVHFHADDLTDARWPRTVELTLPDDLRSGIYGLKITAAGQEDYVPFFVRPSPGGPTAAVAFLAPTATYLAYANSRFNMYAAEITGTP